MRCAILAIDLLVTALPAVAQIPAIPPAATDVTASDIDRFMDALPRDRASDQPIRTVEVTGGHRVGVFGVLRPPTVRGDAILHRVNTTGIEYLIFRPDPDNRLELR